MAVSVYSLFRVFGSIEDLDRISREDFDSQQSILMATVHFQRQAQEFNQVLLRGDDPAALDKSWAAFETSERAAAEEARLARSSSPHKEVRDAVEAFLAQHRTAGEAYRRGLEAFKAAKADPRAASGPSPASSASRPGRSSTPRRSPAISARMPWPVRAKARTTHSASRSG